MLLPHPVAARHAWQRRAKPVQLRLHTSHFWAAKHGALSLNLVELLQIMARAQH